MCNIHQPSNDRALQACCWKPDPDGVLRVIPSSWRIPPAAVQLQLFIKLVQGNDCSWEDWDIDLGGAESKVKWLWLPVKSCIFQMWLVAKCLSECVTKHTGGGGSSSWTWMEAFTVRAKVLISSQPHLKPLEQRPFSSSDPKISFLSEISSENCKFSIFVRAFSANVKDWIKNKQFAQRNENQHDENILFYSWILKKQF